MRHYLFGLAVLTVLSLAGQQENSNIEFSGTVTSGSSGKPSFSFGKKDVDLLWLDTRDFGNMQGLVGFGDFQVISSSASGSFQIERKARLKVLTKPSEPLMIRFPAGELLDFEVKIQKRDRFQLGGVMSNDAKRVSYSSKDLVKEGEDLVFNVSEKVGPNDVVDIGYKKVIEETEEVVWSTMFGLKFQLSEVIVKLPSYYIVTIDLPSNLQIDSLESSSEVATYNIDKEIPGQSVTKATQLEYEIQKWFTLAERQTMGSFHFSKDAEEYESSLRSVFQEEEILISEEISKRLLEEQNVQRFMDANPDANAIILYDRATNNLDVGEYRREMKIKVLTKDGLGWGDFETPFIPRDGSSRLTKIQVTVTNEDGEETEITEMSKEAMYKVDIDNRGSVYRFSAPNVRKGSVIDVSYTLDIFSALNWTFQTSAPTLESYYKVVIPDFVNFSKELKGYVPISFDEYFQNQNKILEFKGERIPAFQSEPFINSSKNYASGVDFVFTGWGTKGGILSEWRDVIRILGEIQGFGYYLKPDKTIRLVSESIVAAGGSEREIAINCYNHIREALEWNKLASFGAQNDKKKVLEKQAGSAGEINLMLVSLLRKAGLSANPIMMKTRREGVMNFSMPRLSELNYVVAGVKTSEGMMILDATDKDRPWNLLPLRALNTFGVMINESNYAHEIVEIPVTQNSKLDVFATASLAEDGTVNGTCQKAYSGFMGFEFRANSDSLEVVDLEARIPDINPAVEVLNYKQIIPEDLVRASKVRFDFSLESQEAGDIVIVDPCVIFFAEKSPFDEEERKYPISIPYAYDFSFRLKLEMPENMVVTSLPKEENLSFEMSGGQGSILSLAKLVDNAVQLTYKFKLDCDFILPEEYERIKGYYDTVLKKQAEIIVLSKLN